MIDSTNLTALSKYELLEDIFNTQLTAGKTQEEAFAHILTYKPYDILPDIDSPQDYRLHNTMYMNNRFLCLATIQMSKTLQFQTSMLTS